MKNLIPLNDKGLPHGYCVVYKNGCTHSGNCINGKKTGQWKITRNNSVPSKIIIHLIGNYHNNRKIGLWKKYSNQNNPYLEVVEKRFFIV